MGSRVRIRLFHILHFVRDLLFPLLKNSKSGIDDRGHHLRITHTSRRSASFHISLHILLAVVEYLLNIDDEYKFSFWYI